MSSYRYNSPVVREKSMRPSSITSAIGSGPPHRRSPQLRESAMERARPEAISWCWLSKVWLSRTRIVLHPMTGGEPNPAPIWSPDETRSHSILRGAPVATVAATACMIAVRQGAGMQLSGDFHGSIARASHRAISMATQRSPSPLDPTDFGTPRDQRVPPNPAERSSRTMTPPMPSCAGPKNVPVTAPASPPFWTKVLPRTSTR